VVRLNILPSDVRDEDVLTWANGRAPKSIHETNVPQTPGAMRYPFVEKISNLWGDCPWGYAGYTQTGGPPACVYPQQCNLKLVTSKSRVLRFDARTIAILSRGLTPTIMAPDPTLELSIEQLISALNKKLFVECARVQAAMPPMSRALVATLTAEVRSRALSGNLGS
jgi:hypothetical protein